MAPGIVDKMASRLHRMSHSSSEGKNESKEVFTAREEEKARLASWQADTKPLEVSEIIVDPQTKPVGHSSKLLRKDDFELIKTLGTGTFARVWLVRLKDAKAGDENKVFALKILRKVDGTSRSMRSERTLLVCAFAATDPPSHPSQAS